MEILLRGMKTDHADGLGNIEQIPQISIFLDYYAPIHGRM
jgi:hypothetical protein